jgi:hypothetical protein
MMQGQAQSYMGKSPILKGIGRLYGGLWCLFSGGNKGRGTVPGAASSFRGAAIELPSSPQNALILLIGETGTPC